MKKEMLINVMQPEECRIAIVEDGILQELYVERTSQESYVNNIYKGKIVNLEPSIQAAFVDFGIGRNGFLHVSDVASAYFRGPAGGGGRGDREDRPERRDDRGPGRDERPQGRRFEPVEIPSGRAPAAEAGDDDFAADLDAEIPAPAPAPEPARAPRAPAQRKAPEPPPMAEAVADDEDAGDFGFGIEVEETQTARAGTVIAAPGTDVADVEDDIVSEIVRPEGDEGEAKPKGRKRTAPAKAKPKKAEAAEAEAKPKRKRVTKKKGEGEAEDAPPMESAERRTAAGDDEFYFDPMGPNDRFSDAPAEEGRPDREVTDDRDDESAEPPAEDFDAEAAEDAPDAPNIGNNFAAPGEGDYEDGPPRDRGRGGDRGGRGGDRGSRGGDRGGPRGGPGGPRGGPRPGGGGGGGGGGFGRGRDGGQRPPPIETIFKRGQEVIVQVIKEGMGTKGPTLSTHISIAGRYLVLAPWLNRVAVSRKIEDEGTRQRLKEIMRELNAPAGVGFIIRTAAVDRNVQELKSDLAYLVRLWEVFSNRVVKRQAPFEVYRESDMVTRTIRDMFTSDIDAIYIDEPEAFAQAQEFMNIVMPRYAGRLKFHDKAEPLFHNFKIEQEVGKLQDKKVPLPGGGSLIIEQTEALVAIDVNSGTFRVEDNAEETAYQTNLQAAKEIARQLRLRNLGGVVVNDFIDMKEERHRRNLEETFRNALRRDRSRTKILKTSAFGVIEMTRQRVQTSLKRTAYQECSHCRGTGLVKTPLSMSIDVMRMIQLAAYRKLAKTVDLTVHPDVATYLLNKKRREISKWEDEGSLTLTIASRPGVSPEFLEIRGQDNNGHEVGMSVAPPPPPMGRPPERRDDRGGDDRGGRGGDRGGDRGGRGGDRGAPRGGGGRGGPRGGGGGRR